MNRGEIIKPLLLKVASIVKESINDWAHYHPEVGFKAKSDIIAQEVFKNEINSYFPNDSIFSEEEFGKNLPSSDCQEFLWIIDPICGTTNFLYQFPFYSHSLSLFRNNECIAAGVYDPLREEMFFSEKGSFFLNDKKLEIKKKVKLAEAVISVNTNQSKIDKSTYSIQKIVTCLAPPVCRRIHILESANLEMAYVACGRLDAYFNPFDKPWDFLAGMSFLHSAKGASAVFSNQKKSLFEYQGIIAASSTSLMNEIRLLATEKL